MPTDTAEAFDRVAADYDALWTTTVVGASQRFAVWQHIERLFGPGDSILDLGCGTGVDALHLQALGMKVYALDCSHNMVRIAQLRGVNAHCCRIEDLQNLRMRFDGALSNFGALNCIDALPPIATALARLIQPGGSVALCFLGSFCLWETLHFLLRGKFAKAFRRHAGKASSAMDVTVFYPKRTAIVSAFHPNFRLRAQYGIGISVPPSYVAYLRARTIARLSAVDRKITHLPVFRSLADHCLYIFERI